MSNFATGPQGSITSQGTTLPAKDWSLTIKGNNKDVSNFRDGRYRIGGLQDFDGEINIPIDISAEPWSATPNLQHGQVVALVLTLATGHSFAVNGIIDEVTPKTDVDGNPTYAVKFSMANGSIVYPA